MTDTDNPEFDPTFETAPTDVDAVPAEEPKATANDIINGLINRVTAIQWLSIRKRYDEPTDVLAGDLTSQLLIANWRKHLEETGKSDFERFEVMGIEAMTDALGVTDLIEQEAQAQAQAAADKSL